MKRSRISFFSGFRLAVQRTLSRGGMAQFLVPLSLLVIMWLLFTGALALLLRAGLADWGTFTTLRSSLNDKGIFGIAFYHLFTTGGVDVLPKGPGWINTVIGIALVGLFTSIFTNYFASISQDYRSGLSDYKLKNHVAFFGFDRTVPDLLKQMLDGRYASCYFLILTSSSVEDAYARLDAVLDRRQRRRVIVLRGEIDSPEGLHRMQAARAQEILIFGDEAGDSEVMKCLQGVADGIPEREPSDRIQCYVMFSQRSAFAVFQFADIGRKIGGRLAFFPFNRHEMWAHKLFINRSLHPSEDGYLPLEGTTGIGPDSQDHVHLVVAGMTPMGVAVGLEAAMLGHYPNVRKHPGARTRITFIDSNVQEGMQSLQARLEAMFRLSRWRFTDAVSPVKDAAWNTPKGTRHLGGDFIDLEWEFIDGTLDAPAVRSYLEELAADARTRLTVAICLPEADACVDAAMRLPRTVCEAAVQIPVYQPEGSSVVDALSSGTTVTVSPYRKLRAFGMDNESFDLGLASSLMKAAASLEKDPGKTEVEIIASKSDAAKLWSNIYNASNIWTKLRSASSEDGKIPDDMREVLAWTEHNRWNAEQLLMQFRPLTKEEQDWVLEKGSVDSGRKGSLKRERMAHFDICSWKRLEAVEPEVLAYDFNMVDSINRI